MTGGATTFVTVVFEPEVGLLRLQARSFASHLPRGMVDRIVVVDNTRRGLPEPTVEAVLQEYGPHRAVVELVRPASFVSLPRTTGWYAQQIVKLAIAATITSDSYVVLDAKNHLIRELLPGDLRDDSDRLRTYTYSFEHHPLRPALERTLSWFRLPEDGVERFTPAVTPYPLVTRTVLELMADFETRAGSAFPRAFVEADLLEFFAYAAFVASRSPGLEALYSLDGAVPTAVWPNGASSAKLQDSLERAARGESPWFAVHRRAFGRLDAAGIGMLADFWQERGIASGAQTRALVDAMIEGVRADERSRRRRELGPRLRRAVRRRLTSLRRGARG